MTKLYQQVTSISTPSPVGLRINIKQNFDMHVLFLV